MTGNSKILKETVAVAAEIKKYYQTEELAKISKVLNKYLNRIVELDKIPACYTPTQTELTHSLGNSKIGKDTLCISFGTGLLCVMGVTGNCGNCAICYAVAENKQFFKNTVPKNSINQKLATDVLLGDLSLHELLQNTVYSIYCKYSQTELDNMKFLRINVEGDILNNDYLVLINQIVECLISVFDLWTAYSYTHNTELDLFLADKINFNTSDFYNACTNQCITIEEITDSIRFEVETGLSALCDGDCNCCSYCKDYNNTKTVYFLKHGGDYKGFKLVEETDSKLAETVRNLKEQNWKYFVLQQTTETF